MHRLLAAHPELAAEAEQIARSSLAEVSFESVADEVEDAVRALDVDTLYNRAGRHERGYTEPGEAAWELLEEAVEPFLEEVTRHLKLGLEAEALEICKGAVLGLYRVRGDSEDEFLGYAPDFPEEAAGRAIETWRSGRGGRNDAAGARRRSFPADFAKQFVPDWTPIITKALREK